MIKLTSLLMKIFDDIGDLWPKFPVPSWVKDLWNLDKHLPAIRDALAKGTSATASGISNSALALYGRIFITKQDIEEMAEDLEDQGGRYRELLGGVLIKKDRLKDSFALGGELYLLDALPQHFPEGIEAAFAAQYPNLATDHSLSDHIKSLDADSQMGFISGLKGKLFEQEYVNYLNDGELPDGFHASLASSPTQQGWDIEVHGADGELAQVLQAKATSSVGYVQDALEKYPEIDIVTTEEVYSQLVMKGISDGLLDSGISNENMVNYVTGAVGLTDSGLDLSDFCPPVITWALIAFTSYRDPSLSSFVEKTEAGGLRFGKAYFAYLLGTGVVAITNTWWLGLAAAVLSRATQDEGYRRFELKRQMGNAKRSNRGIIRRWAGSARAVVPA